MSYGDADGHRLRTFTQRQAVASIAGVPLLTGDEVLGIMCVNYRTRRRFSDDEKLLIELFAQQAALALQTAQQREQERRLAVAQERAALSRELHHSVSQDLFAVELKTRTALYHLQGEGERAGHELADILEIVERAKGQVGFLISEFSAAEAPEEGFHVALHRTLARIRRYYDIDVRCERRGETVVPAQAHFALSRIAKEALNNAIRHARCAHVVVSYGPDDGEFVLQVADDGIGFDPARTPGRGDKLGIRAMQEYAETLGGRLEIDSAPGAGTRVAVSLPLARAEEGE